MGYLISKVWLANKKTIYLVTLFIVLGTLSSCTRIYWTKPGFTQEQWNIDLAKCNLAATQNVPPNYQTTYSNVGGGTTNCYNYGNSVQCNTTPPVQIPTTRDVNKSAREQFRNNCLTLLGYQAYRK